MHLHSGDAGEKQTPHRVPVGDPLQRVKPREIWVRQLISPLIEFTTHMVGRQRAAMGVEQEDQLHQDRRRVGLLGAKVEHRHDGALIVTAHRESDPGGQRALVREDHVTEEELQSSALDPHS